MTGFFFRLIPPRPDFAFSMTEDERSTMLQHSRYWSSLAGEGRVVAFGPVDDPKGSYGIGIVLAEDATDAQRVRDADPAMTSPHGFTTEIAPMLRLVTATGQW
jgi:uncharacterized protein YciI